MAYTKTTWVDEVLSGSERYNILQDDGTPIESNVRIELETAVAVAGTGLSAAAMNNIEDGLEAVDKLSTRLLNCPRGFMINGKLSVTVASNNLTVAVKTLADADPSASDPVYVRIGDVVRVITSALSVTAPAATNWCNAGSDELKTKEIDWFPYLTWNTSLATPAVDILFSRIPYANLFSEFSATSTNEKYACQNATAPAATDTVELIGRFAATLSAGAGYTWSVPTFTAANLISRPIYETRWLEYVPTPSNVTVGSGTLVGKYHANGRECDNYVHFTLGAGSAISGDVTFKLPFTPALVPAQFSGYLDDYGTNLYAGWGIPSGSVVYVRSMDDATYAIASAALSATIPFTWTTNDAIKVTGKIIL